MLISAGLFAFTLVLYLITFSPLGAGDGPVFFYHAMSGELSRMFPLQIVLHKSALHLYLRLVTIGSPLPLAMQEPLTLTRVAQIPFAIAAAAGVSLFFHLVLRITRQVIAATAAALLLTFSHGYWFNANLEMKAYTLLSWLLTFALCSRRTRRRYWQLTLVALSGAVTTLCEIDAGICAFVVLYCIIAENRGNLKQAVKELLFVAAIWGSVLASVLWIISLQMPSLHEWVFQYSTGGEFLNFLNMRDDFRLFVRNPLKGLLLSLAIGQSDAFAAGFMLPKRIFVDGDFVPLDYARLLMYLCVALFALYYAVLGVVSLRRQRPKRDVRVAAHGLIVWFASYHLLTWWNQPIKSDYRVLSLPPLLVLLALGIVHHLRSGSWVGRALPAMFFLLLAVNNWVLGIHPASIHGKSVRDTYRYLRQTADPQDVLLISEWSVPLPPQVSEENAWSPGAFAAAAADRSTAEIIHLVRTSVGGALADGRRVFVWGLVPGRHTLRSMNRFRADDDLFGAAQFEQLQAELMAYYVWHPVFSVVDARNQAAYQLGRQWATLWVICPEGWPDCWVDTTS